VAITEPEIIARFQRLERTVLILVSMITGESVREGTLEEQAALALQLGADMKAMADDL
jgi:hypothetical protein